MKRKDILMILIPSFIFAIAWIIFSIHHNIASSTISETVNVQIAPISANFDLDAIASLKTRQNIALTYRTDIPIQNIIIPATPSAEITPTPTPSIEETPISSDSENPAASGGSLLQ